jgi:anti-anti-sigma regulatory factor
MVKFKLAESNGVNVLSIEGKLDVEGFKILKAGIIKLFKDGRNRILIDLGHTDGIDHDVVHDLALMNVTARELSGEIALGGLTPELCTMIKSVSKPPVISHFRTNEEAFAFFRQSTTAAEPAAPADVAKKEEEDKFARELKALKEENEMLKKEKETLQVQLKDLVIQRRNPPTEQAYKDKISILEKRISELTSNSAMAALAKPDTPATPAAAPGK